MSYNDKANKRKGNKPELKEVSLLDLIKLCRYHYKWFIASLAISLLLTKIYLLKTPNQYTRETTILVKMESEGKSAGPNVQDEFSTLGMVQQNTNVNNVMTHITSLNVVADVVKRMGLAKDEKKAQKIAEGLRERTKVSLNDKKSTILTIKFVDKSPERAEKFLNTLVKTFNEQWMNDKNKIVANTSKVISARLGLIEQNLENIDDSISSYKSRNQITDINTVSNMYLSQMTESESELLNKSSQKAIAEYILELVRDNKNKHKLLPANSGINDRLTEELITQYNNSILQLNTHLRYTSGQNPMITNLEEDINKIKESIQKSLSNFIKAQDIQIAQLEKYSSNASSKIISKPDQAKYLISIERQQIVKENLYKYLLQKLEENEINMTSTSEIIQMIDPPYGSDKPSTPNKVKITLVALVLALVLPAIFLYIKNLLDTTVHNRNDVEQSTSIPFLGEIPEIQVKLRYILLALLRRQKYTRKKIYVEPDGKDLMNDAIRIIRSNIETLQDGKKFENRYLLTSHHKNAGKTFATKNIGAAFAIQGKRTLIIDGDLRKASLSASWRESDKGLSDYLSGTENDTNSLIFSDERTPLLHILPAGTIPHNPTELLSNGKIEVLLQDLSQRYDYIFIDSPAMENIADSLIIEKYTNHTIYIIRADVFDNKSLAKLDKEYEALEHKNCSIILNAVNKSVY